MTNEQCINTLKTLGLLEDFDTFKDKDLEVLYKSEYPIHRIVSILNAGALNSISLILGLVYDNDHMKLMERIEILCKNIVKYTDKKRALSILAYIYVGLKVVYDKKYRKLHVNDTLEVLNESKVISIVYNKKIGINIENKRIMIESVKDKQDINWIKLEKNDRVAAILFKDDTYKIIDGPCDLRGTEYDFMIIPYNGANIKMIMY